MPPRAGKRGKRSSLSRRGGIGKLTNIREIASCSSGLDPFLQGLYGGHAGAGYQVKHFPVIGARGPVATASDVLLQTKARVMAFPA